MKKTITEELQRIHTLNYGKEFIEEGFIDKLLKGIGLKKDSKKIDDPKKADLVSDDVQEFFKNLEDSSNSGGLSQQSYGSMKYQKGVESMQIGLILLGYELPQHGVDGLFGPETAGAVQKFITDNKIEISSNKETIQESPKKIKLSLLEAALNSPLDSTSVNSAFGPRWGRTHTGIDLKADAENVKSPADGVVEVGEIRNDICGGTIIISHAGGFKSGFCHMQKINVKPGQQVKQGDIIGISGGGSNDPGKGRSDGRHLHFTLRKDGKAVNPLDYIDKSGIVMTNNTDQKSIVVASPEVLNKLIELLKQKGVKSEDLKSHIDPITTGGGTQFTDLDLKTDEGKKKYTEICQRFISNKKSNLLNITGAMLTRGAVKAFERHGRYVPPELALAQLTAEGGFSNNPDARPIKTKNPFNVGNVDSGVDSPADTVQEGIDRYFDLIAKDYLGKGKTATDLVNNFVNKKDNRYASSQSYERDVNTIAMQANRIAQNITSV